MSVNSVIISSMQSLALRVHIAYIYDVIFRRHCCVLVAVTCLVFL